MLRPGGAIKMSWTTDQFRDATRAPHEMASNAVFFDLTTRIISAHA
jgi:hypothetical protein